MKIFKKTKCPFRRRSCRPDCALFVEHEKNGQTFGYCGLLGPFLTQSDHGYDLNMTGQHVKDWSGEDGG